MKILRTLALAVAALAVAAVSAISELNSLVVAAYHTATGWMTSIVVGPPLQAVEPDRPVVRLVRAAAYRLRLVKRERVLISPSWRMCPSC